jgi:hypothetical protein
MDCFFWDRFISVVFFIQTIYVLKKENEKFKNKKAARWNGSEKSGQPIAIIARERNI